MDSRFVESYTCLYEEYQANNQKEVWDLPSFYSFYQILKRTITTNRSIHNSFYTIDDINTDRLTAVLRALPDIVQEVEDPEIAQRRIYVIADQESKDLYRYFQTKKRGGGLAIEPLEILTDEGSYIENPSLSSCTRRDEVGEHLMIKNQIDKVVRAISAEPNGEEMLLAWLQSVLDDSSAKNFVTQINSDSAQVLAEFQELVDYLAEEDLISHIKLDSLKDQTWTAAKIYLLREKAQNIARSHQ